MAVEVRVDSVVAAPLTKVATYCADPRNLPDWVRNISNVECQDPGGLREGSFFTTVTHFGGKPASWKIEVVEYAPLRRMMHEAVDGPFPVTVGMLWARKDDASTSVALLSSSQPSSDYGYTDTLLEKAIRRYQLRFLNRLNEVLTAAG